MLKLYTFFHLNLMFSSVEEEQCQLILDRCYWPLLRLARKYSLPFGIEAPACTLEIIQAIDPAWIYELRELINEGPCEFIGSGYAQVIGPLVPPEVNRANLRVGMHVYQEILGQQPTIALVNEQAFSAGLVPFYREAGYAALIMEWNNPSRFQSSWDNEWRYHPQQALGVDGTSIPLIWNESIAFQKFQRYAHSELDLPDLLTYIRSHNTTHERFFPLYGSDAEIFDFRPGRYKAEAPLQDSEWGRIQVLFESIAADPLFSLITPSALLQNLDVSYSGNLLSLESAAQPIPVKKQDKYNILRWALTGRDDLGINSRCHRLHQSLLSSSNSTDADWKELCFLWSSDFRTHITSSRWEKYLDRLSSFEHRWPVIATSSNSRTLVCRENSLSPPRWSRCDRWLTVFTDYLEVRFNLRRGLAVDYFINRRFLEVPLFGTLHHGRFDDISWGADFYSGHLVFQSPGRHQITDLVPVDPSICCKGSCLEIFATIPTSLGPIFKTWTINADNHTLSLRTQINWPEACLGRLRLIPLTLFSESFNHSSLQVSAANGGDQQTNFQLYNQSVDHSKAVSFLVSACQGLSLTDGVVHLGDASYSIKVSFDPADAALIGQLQHQKVDSSWFTRLYLSARELDDTAKHVGFDLDVQLTFDICPVKAFVS